MRLHRNRRFAVYVRKQFRIGIRTRKSTPTLPAAPLIVGQQVGAEALQALGITDVKPVRMPRTIHVEVHLGFLELRLLRR